MKLKGYRFGVNWIARNDENLEYDCAEVEQHVSVLLLADLFGVEPSRVARDVVELRRKIGVQERVEREKRLRDQHLEVSARSAARAAFEHASSLTKSRSTIDTIDTLEGRSTCLTGRPKSFAAACAESAAKAAAEGGEPVVLTIRPKGGAS